MVVVAAVALGSSTYAWFASNSKVTATGMQVQAQTEGGIEIAYTNAAATTGASTAKTDTYETLTLTEKAITGQAFGKTGSLTVGDTTTDYYMHQTFNIRSTSATALAKGLTVDSVSVAGNTKPMDQALRVAIKLADKFLVYDPVDNDTTAYKVYSGYTGTGTADDPFVATEAGSVTCTSKDTATLLAASADTTIATKAASANGGVDVEVYIYFEGEDTQLYSDNFATEGLTVTINFSATTN